MYLAGATISTGSEPGTRVPGATISTGSEPGSHVPGATISTGSEPGTRVPGAVSPAESHAFTQLSDLPVDLPLRWRLHFQKQHLNDQARTEHVHTPGTDYFHFDTRLCMIGHTYKQESITQEYATVIRPQQKDFVFLVGTPPPPPPKKYARSVGKLLFFGLKVYFPAVFIDMSEIEKVWIRHW